MAEAVGVEAGEWGRGEEGGREGVASSSTRLQPQVLRLQPKVPGLQPQVPGLHPYVSHAPGERGVVPLLQLVAACEELRREALVAEACLCRLGLGGAYTLVEHQQREAALLPTVLLSREQQQSQPMRAILGGALLQHRLVGEAAEKAVGQGVLRLEVDKWAAKVSSGSRYGGGVGRGARLLIGSYTLGRRLLHRRVGERIAFHSRGRIA